MKIFTDEDASLSPLLGKTVAISAESNPTGYKLLSTINTLTLLVPSSIPKMYFLSIVVAHMGPEPRLATHLISARDRFVVLSRACFLAVAALLPPPFEEEVQLPFPNLFYPGRCHFRSRILNHPGLPINPGGFRLNGF